MAEDAVVVARDEYAEFRRDGRVPGEEVLQVGRVEAFASVTGTDEDVGFGWYGKPPIHLVCRRMLSDLPCLRRALPLQY